MEANQSRGRVGPSTDSGGPLDQSTDAFQYSPLPFDVDSIRLLIIEPTENIENPIHCKLQHVTFAEKPKYEALSYMWGDESRKTGIVVDGKEFQIGLPLFQALEDLRLSSQGRAVWVDAICINQRDIPERNKQISIMPYIYQRAKCVIVSLLRIDQLPGFSSTYLHEEPFSSMRQQEQFNLIRSLCGAEYWQRVWIIQECSLARKLQIMSGPATLSWKTFIDAVISYTELENSVPMRLHKQMEQKYADGHKLQRLLESHQDALCRDPRDKVYGFVGLASDILEGFPMDYGKTLFEVWKDTVMFRNSDTESPRRGIMKFGKLVQNLLGGGKGIAIHGEVACDITLAAQRLFLQGDKKPSHNTTLSIPGQVIGRISYIGPTYNEIISDLKQTATWRTNINKYIPDSQRASAREATYFFETWRKWKMKISRSLKITAVTKC